jgi:hypothetical protein
VDGAVVITVISSLLFWSVFEVEAVAFLRCLFSLLFLIVCFFGDRF